MNVARAGPGGVPAFLPDLLAFWRDNVACLVPDPGNTIADHTAPADWLAAALRGHLQGMQDNTCSL